MGLIRDILIRIGVKAGDAKKDVKALQLSFTELNQATELARKGFNLLTGVASKTFETLDRGGQVINLSRGFESLQESVGNLANQSIRDLQGATQGLISDFDLMQSANQTVAARSKGRDS